MLHAGPLGESFHSSSSGVVLETPAGRLRQLCGKQCSTDAFRQSRALGQAFPLANGRENTKSTRKALAPLPCITAACCAATAIAWRSGQVASAMGLLPYFRPSLILPSTMGMSAHNGYNHQPLSRARRYYLMRALERPRSPRYRRREGEDQQHGLLFARPGQLQELIPRTVLFPYVLLM